MSVPVLPQPQLPDPRTGPSLRWAILGSGWIAAQFVRSLREHTNQRVVAVGSRSLARAEAFAAEHGIAHAYGSYEELVASDIDVVYVATGHLDHFAHAALALEAGRPVLVEKPMTPRLAETRALAALARARGLFAMEAVWTVTLPRYAVIRQILEQGMLGDVVEVHANLGERLVDHHRAMDPAQGGGVMNDLGSYTLMFANEIIPGLRVRAAHGRRHALPGAAGPGAIGEFHALLGDDGDRLATVSASMLADTPTTAYVAGTEATLILEAPFYQPGPVVVRFHGDAARTGVPAGTELRVDEPALAHDQLFWEALEVARCIDAGLTESPLRPLDRSIETIALVEEARAAMGDPLPAA
ncbi:Gfo/Idh/MocA family oxidoreductase [Leucobacter allii]|uniref:Gfo/Idh/MocA family protein n=1 Tax=Leucobacter allii TaxID=2932247 RepID=UPI001FD290A4|nr:Gfo/Idh/MocA family oxidoreductase [Leucobacter allii]UOR01413.1 Gfo/Idh/MocA family oxidoreductase [Leucobacter allii]